MNVESGFNDDFLDILRAMVESGTEFLVVGAHALALHGVPRSTGDLDVWVHPTPENAQRVLEALEAFGAPIQANDVSLAYFSAGGLATGEDSVGIVLPTGLTADDITFSYTPIGGSTTVVPVMVIVPEPSAIALLAMGAFGLLAYGWRRRRQSA